MSIRCIDWAFAQMGLKPTEKLVLVKLADNANDDGYCYPSQAYVAKHVGVSRSRINQIVKRLAQLDLLEVVHRVKDGVNLPNAYMLKIEGVVNLDRGGSKPSEQRTVNEPSEESISSEDDLFDSQCQKQQDGCESEDESFKRFYDAYPRKVGRGQARKAYKTALKKVDAGTLQRAVEAFASLSKGKEAQYIKHPSTWLNGECWADEELKGAVAPGAGGDGSGSGRFDWRWAMTEWRKTGMWYAPGEPPGNPGCRVPLDILREFGF